ncbi:MAG: hypothetical protein Sapg2KO_43700 [Saprospiraceae bacterium]
MAVSPLQSNKISVMKILVINSKGYWKNGWMTTPAYQKIVLDLLIESNLKVEAVEVSNEVQLNNILANTTTQTLVWANAYWVDTKNGKPQNLIKAIEAYNLPLIGSNSKTLLSLLEKDYCQSQLAAANIPIPPHIIILQHDINRLEAILVQSELLFPLVLKPTKEARSSGVTLVHDLDTALNKGKEILEKYPQGNLIIEAFLPSDDITCGVIRLGDEEIIMPSYNVIRGMDCTKEVFSEHHYALPPGSESQTSVEDTVILKQLKNYVPIISDIFNIQTVTRVDGRLDQNQSVNFFDINGLPGLNYPKSALIKQCFIHFPNYEPMYLFRCLIHTIIMDNLLKYNIAIPHSFLKHNLFNLKSESIVKVKSYFKSRI